MQQIQVLLFEAFWNLFLNTVITHRYEWPTVVSTLTRENCTFLIFKLLIV